MALATLCPYCHTAFRVANDQLKLHAGLVRCGACQQTFNGIEHLLAPGQVPARVATPSASGPDAAPPLAATTVVAAVITENIVNDAGSVNLIESADPDASTPIHTEVELSALDSLDFDLGTDDQLNISSQEEIGQLELQTQATLMSQSDSDWSISEFQADETDNLLEQTSSATAETSPDLALIEDIQPKAISATEAQANEEEFVEAQNTDSTNDDLGEHESVAEKPDFVVQAEEKQRRGRAKHLLLILLSLLLFLTLLAQATYSFRNSIAAWLPQTKPLLQDACKLLHCQIELPAQIEMISIESNELQVMAADKNIFSLILQLQNKSGTLQSWPMLELILNDTKDKPVLQRVFRPAEYLSNKSDLPKGFSAGSEPSIKLYFELSGLKAAGYHVGVFYP